MLNWQKKSPQWRGDYKKKIIYFPTIRYKCTQFNPL